ncbi:MAG: hypothetical protein H6742_18075 [Alphaproteobacteria bacterium]|nr:hypothetical protein [Alphaproteobacteria bacterium]
MSPSNELRWWSSVALIGCAVPVSTLAVGCAPEEGLPDACAGAGIVCSVVGVGTPGANPAATTATEHPLYGPMDVAFRGDDDAFFIADWNNHQIKLVEAGLVQTVVGTDFLGDGDPDFQERIPPGVPGTTVALNHPTSLEWNDVTGRLLLPSWHNHRVREWDPATGYSLVVAADTAIDDGNGANAGFAGDGGPAADALMAFPNSIAIDPADGSFWLLPQGNTRLRWVAADFSLIDTVAGTGERGATGDGGPAIDATFHFWYADDLQPEPAGAVEHDPDRGLLYIADTVNHEIRVIDLATGLIDTLPGTGGQTLPDGQCDPDALCFPRDVELAPDGRLWIADEGNHVIRVYDPDTASLETAIGTFEPGDGPDGLPPLETMLQRPYGVDVGADGTVLVADTYNHRIRRLIP